MLAPWRMVCGRELQNLYVFGSSARRSHKKNFDNEPYGIYRHLGEWLQTKSESDLERRYVAVGERRAAQGVPLSQLALAIVVTKEHLSLGAHKAKKTDGAVDLFQMLQLSISREIL
jgi:hypothetical protein